MAGKKQPTSPDKALAIADALTLGDESAAKMHHVSTRTLRRWRTEAKQDPDLAKHVRTKGRELAADWLEAAKAARHETLSIALTLARKSEDLHDVAGFLKIVNDAVAQDEMLLNGRDSKGSGAESVTTEGHEVSGGNVLLLRRSGSSAAE